MDDQLSTAATDGAGIKPPNKFVITMQDGAIMPWDCVSARVEMSEAVITGIYIRPSEGEPEVSIRIPSQYTMRALEFKPNAE